MPGEIENLIPYQWKPGQSGNPAGKPPLIEKLNAEIRQATKDILAAPCEIEQYVGKTRLQAALMRCWEQFMAKQDTRALKILLEYAYGKPIQPLAGAEDAQPIRLLLKMVDGDGNGNNRQGNEPTAKTV
jgi:hypothetical protein